MKYRIKGDSDFSLVEIDLASNETIKIERGAMAYMQDVDIKGKMNIRLSIIKRQILKLKHRRNTVFFIIKTSMLKENPINKVFKGFND